ncbi:SOS regulatory protein LexA [Clostridium sp. USBA 49]|jgi:SOS regulatory protein LexA|uniref:transcriptional repressor LexA n=1 Tax=Clostridium TaxID=1485 RepID=UPI00099A522C|nr:MULTISPECIES: transcriptional repressor LexA [Clostridium]SKA73255.1 SOS regulatory protein LexA [Clostridium sp. USBA 49]
MQLDAAQNRIIKSRPFKYSILKGKSGSGKTMTAAYRALYLKNNYCLYENDKILILTQDSTKRDELRNIYNEIEDDVKQDYKTLLSTNIEAVEVLTILDIVNRFYFEYTNNTKNWYKIVQEDNEINKIIKESIELLRKEYENKKILSEKYFKFLKEEIVWIKSCNFEDLDVYQNIDRIGRRCKKGEGPQRLLKNSKEREIIFKLYEIYNKKLEERRIIDFEDIFKVALKMALNEKHKKYTHIIVDEAENLSKVQIDFIKELLNNKTYSSLMFILNKSNDINKNSWFIKGRKISNLELGNTVKSYNLYNTYKTKAQTQKGEVEMSQKFEYKSFMEYFEYIDLKHSKKYNFKRDIGINDTIYIDYGKEEEIIKSDELKSIPVYSDIAAGEPIMMNDEILDEFYLPEYFFKGSKDSFILKVKGDSMIGANIFDGDYVVIRKQSTAVNGDLVAVDLDGNATLKRLSLNNGVPVLMPENEKYDPIFMHDKDDASILGIVIGIIKYK